MPKGENWQKQAMVFLAGIIGFSAFIYLLVYPLVMWQMQAITAMLSSVVLNLLGIPSVMISGVPPIITAGALTAQIVPLCVGDIELAVLIAAILSTADRKWKERIHGAVMAIVFVFIINPIRIALTLGAGAWLGIDAMVFLHTFLFRLTLLVVLVVFYAAWYLWPVKIKRKKERKKG